MISHVSKADGLSEKSFLVFRSQSEGVLVKSDAFVIFFERKVYPRKIDEDRKGIRIARLE